MRKLKASNTSSRKCDCGGGLRVMQTVTGGYGAKLTVLRRYRCLKCQTIYKTIESVVEVKACKPLKAK